MLSAEDFFKTSLELTGTYSNNNLGTDLGGTTTVSSLSWCEPGYEGTVDYRIRQLSYSSRNTLRKCARKFQLYKLRSTHRAEESLKSTITFAFGHFVGEAIQQSFEGVPDSQIIFNQFLKWKPDLFAEDEKLNKSFWTAVIAFKRFQAARKAGFLDDYELVYYQGKPACELSFTIVFPDGFRYRGHVDIVLRHRLTGEIVVLECKTTGMAAVNPAVYKYSAQAIGYSIVLDAIFPELSAYKVLYLVYTTKQMEFHTFPFAKSFLQRALWIRELLLDIEMIKMYEEAEIYPMNGEACFDFFRECEYINSCTLSTNLLTKPCTPEEEDKIDYQIVVSLADLIDSQLSKEVKV
jgi:hypothetical protein